MSKGERTPQYSKASISDKQIAPFPLHSSGAISGVSIPEQTTQKWSQRLAPRLASASMTTTLLISFAVTSIVSPASDDTVSNGVLSREKTPTLPAEEHCMYHKQHGRRKRTGA